MAEWGKSGNIRKGEKKRRTGEQGQRPTTANGTPEKEKINNIKIIKIIYVYINNIHSIKNTNYINSIKNKNNRKTIFLVSKISTKNQNEKRR